MLDSVDLTRIEDQISALRREVQILKDKEEIRDVIYRYGYCADVDRYDEFLDTLTSDVVWTASGTATPGLQPPSEAVFRGRDEALTAVSSPGHSQIVNCEQHIMANFIIDIDGDHARAIGHLLLTVHHWGGFALGTCRYTHMSFVRQDGRWRISEVTFRETGHPESNRYIIDSGLLSYNGSSTDQVAR